MRQLVAIVTVSMFASALASRAAVLPAGTKLEVRLCAATGSRISHPGDPINATIIAPAFQQNRLVLPEGATISGVVESVDRLGFGIKHRTASIKYRFDSVRLPEGAVFPVQTRVLEVETARERVNDSGTIGGIYPAANLSSGASFVISAMVADPAIAAPVLAIKFLIARSPDPEIYFPAGAELILTVVKDAVLPNTSSTSATLAPLTSEEVASVQDMLDTLPQQQTDPLKNRTSDLLNVLLLGSREQVEHAFQAAGWFGEQRHSVLALYRMYHCIVQRDGYGMAPMTRLTLHGSPPDLAYQKSLDTMSKRHHIRLWSQPSTGVWLGAAVEDVGYAVRRMRLTHATDPEIDNERAKVVNDLWLTGCISAGSLIPRDSSSLINEYGTPIKTDRMVAALRLNDCQSPPTVPLQIAKSAPGSHGLARMFTAVGIDIGRSNPIALGYNSLKSISDLAAVKRVGATPFRNTSGSFLAASSWRRSSVIDAGRQPDTRASSEPAKLSNAPAPNPLPNLAGTGLPTYRQ